MTSWFAAPAIDPDFDARMMREALGVGRRQLGQTWPNPAVGAVVVSPQGDIIGRGATAPGGRPHAEALALDAAGDAATGGTIYVTLEPCAHRSVRGGMPCLERIIRSGISRVVFAIEDPNPHISGLSHALLRSAGIRTTAHVESLSAARDHLGHVLRVREGRPMLTLKIAETADGFCAPEGGGRLQISSDAAMQAVHQLRAEHDAIMVGIATVLSDDPLLTARGKGADGTSFEARSPLRIVIDSDLRLPLDSKLVSTAATIPVWVIAAEDAEREPEQRLRDAGLEVMRVGRLSTGGLDLAAAFRLLGLRGITRVFSEGGPRIANSLATADLVDTFIRSTSDRPLGQPGMRAVLPDLASRITDQALFDTPASVRHGSDLFRIYERKR
jgi:diaminohydroxyphosphoribosylaminopyrimidine deaminase / 5-amino-6-(5-phosphoribosylamino)uracil reductase